MSRGVYSNRKFAIITFARNLSIYIGALLQTVTPKISTVRLAEIDDSEASDSFFYNWAICYVEMA